MCPTVRSPIVSWGEVAARFPPRPGPELDPILDAAGACLERYGLRRTTMTDIAREAGIARSTLYQRVSSVDQAVLGYATRELHRFLDDQRAGDDVGTARGLVTSIVALVRWIWDQPAYSRLLDETELLVRAVSSRHPVLDVVAHMLSPALALLIDAGVIRDHDPDLLAGWIARTIVMVTLAPPAADLEDVLVAMLLPALEPTPPPR